MLLQCTHAVSLYSRWHPLHSTAGMYTVFVALCFDGALDSNNVDSVSTLCVEHSTLFMFYSMPYTASAEEEEEEDCEAHF